MLKAEEIQGNWEEIDKKIKSLSVGTNRLLSDLYGRR